MHEAIIARLTNVRPHENADRLKLATVAGHQIVVGLDNTENEIGVFFYSELQVSEEYAEVNDLIGYTDPETGERKGGFFPKNRRVRAQRFRGEKSEGYWAPLDSLAYTGYDLNTLKEGDKFKELNGHPICEKYFTPATLRAMRRNKNRRINATFKKHVDTRKFQYDSKYIPAGSIIYLSEKVHGTSQRIGRVIEEQKVKRNWFARNVLRMKPKVVKSWEVLIGTRNVILGTAEEVRENTLRQDRSFYGSESFRYHVCESLVDNLLKGEILYFEVVGYLPDGRPIMADQPTSSLKDKNISKTYGDTMHYSYGNVKGNCDMYVYRITRTNEDGDTIDLSWPQIKARCRELGVKYVPELGEDYQPYLYQHHSHMTVRSYMDQYDIEKLASEYVDGPSVLDGRHIREGVVLRVERPDGETEWYKLKSFTFGVLEGYLKEDEESIDLEEVS